MKNKAVIAFLSVVMAVSLTAVLSQSASMQEATPSGESETTGGPAFPSQIQKGTCDNIGDVAYGLADVGLAKENGKTAAIVGSGNVVPVYTGTTEYGDVSLSDLVNGEYVVTVSKSADAKDEYIACGAIGGSQVGNTVMFGLLTLNDSGYDGSGMISQDENGKTLYVVVYVLDTSGSAAVQGTPMAGATPQPAGESTSTNGAATPATSASPAASPGASSAPQTDITLGMYDIGFTKNDLTVPANTDITVTLKNTGVIKHNFTIEDQDVSVDVQSGETGTATFNLPAGDYTYFCDVPGHRAAGMVGTLHVV